MNGNHNRNSSIKDDLELSAVLSIQLCDGSSRRRECCTVTAQWHHTTN